MRNSSCYRGEDSAALQTLTDEHYAFWNPANPVERDLVNILVRTTRLLRRLDRVEDEIWTSCIGNARAPYRANTGGRVRANGRQVFSSACRAASNACQRNYHKALQDRQHLRPARNSNRPCPRTH
jgi:hypothetical protein